MKTGCLRTLRTSPAPTRPQENFQVSSTASYQLFSQCRQSRGPETSNKARYYSLRSSDQQFIPKGLSGIRPSKVYRLVGVQRASIHHTLSQKILMIIEHQALQHKNPFLKIMYTEMMHLCKKFMKYYKEMCLKYHCLKY